jgi:hypothetical protein
MIGYQNKFTCKQVIIEFAHAPDKPDNVTQLRSFLGLVQYYGKFLQNLATVARPLNELLEKKAKIGFW